MVAIFQCGIRLFERRTQRMHRHSVQEVCICLFLTQVALKQPLEKLCAGSLTDPFFLFWRAAPSKTYSHFSLKFANLCIFVQIFPESSICATERMRMFPTSLIRTIQYKNSYRKYVNYYATPRKARRTSRNVAFPAALSVLSCSWARG